MAAGLLLVAGCRTATHNAVAPKVTVEKNSSQKKAERTSAPASGKLAQAHALYASGVLHELNGETELALQEFRQAALDDPDDEAVILDVTRRLLQSKQPEKALEILQLAAARPGATGDTFARLGFVCARLGKTDEAIAANRMAIKKAPRVLAGYQNLFFHFLQAKQSEQALKVLDEAATQPAADAEFLIAVAGFYQAYALQFPSQREAVRAKALEMLNRAEALKPRETQTRLRLAESLYQLGNTDKAAQIYLTLLDQLDELPLVRENVRTKLADIYLRGNDRKRAVEQLEALVRDDPSDSRAYYFLGSIAYDEKRWAEAVEFLNKALIFRPNFEQAYYDLAGAQIASEKPADAVTTLETARKKFPQSFIAEYLLAIAHGRLKNYAEAVRHFTAAEVVAKATNPKPLTAGFYFEMGAACERNADRKQAEIYFERCLELQPDFSEAQNYLGYMWAEKGENLDRARELIERAVKAEPKNAAFLDSMGWVFFKLNQPKEALDYILKAVDLNEEPDATLYDHLGDVYAALNQMDKAREAWRKSVAVEKNDAVQKKLEEPVAK